LSVVTFYPPNVQNHLFFAAAAMGALKGSALHMMCAAQDFRSSSGKFNK